MKNPLSPETLAYLADLAYISVRLHPRQTFGEGTYSGPLNEMLVEHRNVLPRGAFLVFSQVRLPWKKRDHRSDSADYNFGRFDEEGHLSCIGGAELKRARACMQGLPEPQDIINKQGIRHAFSRASIQAEDQVKSAIRNGALPRNCEIPWIVAVGPYFVIEKFGPMSDAELNTRSHKPNEDSGDEEMIVKALITQGNSKYIPLPGSLYRVGTVEAAKALHQYLIDGTALYANNDRFPRPPPPPGP